VFRPMLIKILEHYFLESSFPDTAKRMEIANACNQILLRDKKGSQLAAKEIVTPQIIANWFANKRKEIRRKSHEFDQTGLLGAPAAEKHALAPQLTQDEAHIPEADGMVWEISHPVKSPTAPEQCKGTHHNGDTSPPAVKRELADSASVKEEKNRSVDSNHNIQLQLSNPMMNFYLNATADISDSQPVTSGSS